MATKKTPKCKHQWFYSITVRRNSGPGWDRDVPTIVKQCRNCYQTSEFGMNSSNPFQKQLQSLFDAGVRECMKNV